jgi:hypothetical protein
MPSDTRAAKEARPEPVSAPASAVAEVKPEPEQRLLREEEPQPLPSAEVILAEQPPVAAPAVEV